MRSDDGTTRLTGSCVVAGPEPLSAPPSATPLQRLFLLRLARLVRLRQSAGVLHPGDWRRRLLDKVIYSIYCDCLDLGVEAQARHLLQLARPEASGPSLPRG